MKIKYLALAVGLFIIQVPIVKSQIPILNSGLLLDKLRLNSGMNGNETVLYSNINGDPFIFKVFKKGILVVNSEEKFEVLLRYDIFANEMHLKVKDEIYAIIHPEKVKLIEVDSLRFIYSKYVKSTGEKPTKDGAFFIVKTDGKCKLLAKKIYGYRILSPKNPTKILSPPNSYLRMIPTI